MISSQKSTLNTIILLAFMAFSSFSQPKMTVEVYIETYKDMAIREMEKHHIPASITLAQGILESASGNSELAVRANNHFGIKCHKGWTGKTFHQDDDEKDECFRKYGSPEDSYRDHSDFLTTRERYRALFDLEITDYKGWAKGLKEAGYATNPRYPELLIRIIEENNLQRFDHEKGRRSAVGGSQEVPESHPEVSDIQNTEPEIEMEGRGGNDRIIFSNNEVKFILAREGDGFWNVAEEFGIYAWQIREYNELTNDEPLVPGEKVYLERKKKKAAYEFHQVQAGETLRSISQLYGIRQKTLARKNGLGPGQEPEEGKVLKLR